MWFKSKQLHVDEKAATVRRKCPQCSNEVDFRLVWNKAGLAIGVPVVSWFTDAAMISTHNNYHLGCPVCGYLEKITRAQAKALRSTG
jgi:predicted RNA-binding Zn-ribbon protein involved in translation (DUF1610 family)